MMRRLLEKERLWFWLYIGTNVAAVVVGGIYAALLLLANPFSPITLLLLGIIWLLDIYSRYITLLALPLILMIQKYNLFSRRRINQAILRIFY